MPNKEKEQQLYDMFIQERKVAKQNLSYFPLHLFSKRVYRAYHNAWDLIDRRLLTEEELNIMKQLGCYKPSRTVLGTRKKPSDYTNII
jgi:hypothetical protein